MKAVHFGAGNIGRGFIGEVLVANGFTVDFVDVNETIVDALNERGSYQIGYAAPGEEKIDISGVKAINNGKNPEAVVQAIQEANIITTAIGPNILPYIAELIAQGLQARRQAGVSEPIDVIACENMIGGTDFLHQEVDKYLTDQDQDYIDRYVGFPNAAVDRIVPEQHHEDALFVSVEPFKEWVVDQTHSKAKNIRLDGVLYVDDLEPYIERKLFSVNTGHASVAYSGAAKGYQTIGQALEEGTILERLKAVLKETSSLLMAKWNFKEADMAAYREKIVERFQNPMIVDQVNRVGRTPIRKLGYNERFIRPIRELKERGLDYNNLLTVVGLAFNFDNPQDDQSVALQEKLQKQPLEEVIQDVTGLDDADLIHEIKTAVEAAK
ncbi:MULTISPECIES: mannitol-1-phosphate 5-dehydrogenase [Aerococcus]|uniref:mannitol-1-phosphate 5-dehydrogenase n=1 Tax=Aerococcus urinae (strain CCUG 59500 / ACS-120-V-Col10a) TaxID=2976812 RepID=UPI000200F3BB|nr:mannitol-1-phosphate 5-dehydrogenase [Aerococcus sp. Group 1]AEA01802.1 mannitol dehydrogenase domain protein [Aerococcus sp. Group 1]MCY3031648.1 mannitol-1-phosphate 5-dehydrogenase [Aerococcus sp. Group 1]MCY3055766.1 mannitol-1-phosphate 5-dehydrogenase [Aerococcus sp. Group 1]MCY3057497.1 mannitol-1-phosphate 5-dehydrogenase [Aerococcus sp. Group 1]MCY3062776.1 mannitol-1-phosphate 5-dehydrogenase [Aerococcus sp. Group 1]